MRDQDIIREIGLAWKQAGAPVPLPPFTVPRIRTLRCGCRQRYQRTVGEGWYTITRCRRHDLLDDLGYLWQWLRTNETVGMAYEGTVLALVALSIIITVFAIGGF